MPKLQVFASKVRRCVVDVAGRVLASTTTCPAASSVADAGARIIAGMMAPVLLRLYKMAKQTWSRANADAFRPFYPDDATPSGPADVYSTSSQACKVETVALASQATANAMSSRSCPPDSRACTDRHESMPLAPGQDDVPMRTAGSPFVVAMPKDLGRVVMRTIVRAQSPQIEYVDHEPAALLLAVSKGDDQRVSPRSCPPDSRACTYRHESMLLAPVQDDIPMRTAGSPFVVTVPKDLGPVVTRTIVRVRSPVIDHVDHEPAALLLAENKGVDTVTGPLPAAATTTTCAEQEDAPVQDDVPMRTSGSPIVVTVPKDLGRVVTRTIVRVQSPQIQYVDHEPAALLLAVTTGVDPATGPLPAATTTTTTTSAEREEKRPGESIHSSTRGAWAPDCGTEFDDIVAELTILIPPGTSWYDATVEEEQGRGQDRGAPRRPPVQGDRRRRPRHKRRQEDRPAGNTGKGRNVWTRGPKPPVRAAPLGRA
ncbi:unnamed protein product (mitochondrion) [Plasmodiophora brassicae]|uniref:Uncharacterized protein n=1 Tax=Plasmodiophora brassicae TaxID=37360 RepID=A0A3P3YFL1_PLABS|nr:unnamed protein product [Plasmodiophora brassicae]